MTDEINTSANNAVAQPEKGDSAGSQQPKYTDADVDRIVAEKINRERKRFDEKYADYPDLKKAADQWKAHEDAQKSELEKLQAQIVEAQNRATQADQRRQTAILRSSVMAEAGKQGVPADRIEAAYKLLNVSDLKIEADDAIPNLSEAVARLLTDNPFLVAQSTPGKPQAPKTSPTNPASTPTGSDWLAEYKANLRGNSGQTFGRGGVRPPSEDK